jgi:hypothetical protein
LDQGEEFYLPEEAAEWIGLKKSEFLSRLIELGTKDDFGFEEIHQYNHLVPSTIEFPDRSYEITDDSYRIRTYVRTYQEKELFHQVVIGGVFEDPEREEEIFFPILIFISRKEEVVQAFSQGNNLVKQTLN